MGMTGAQIALQPRLCLHAHPRTLPPPPHPRLHICALSLHPPPSPHAGEIVSMDACLPAGSSQGIGYGILKGLAGAGADVVMHGLVEAQELEEKVAGIRDEFGVKVGRSSANVRKPQEIR